jgi:4-amino-4-deoxy-L-arabinose transferase-like glycosyltransferase
MPWNVHILILTVLSALLLFANLHRGDLSGYDDAVYAHEAKTMILTGDWWNVRFNGYLNFEYPPLFLWMEALSMKAFGFTDFAAKFPAAVLGLATILATGLLAFELTRDGWLSVFSMLVLMSTQYFMKYATHAMTDVPFAFFIVLAAVACLRGLQRPNYLLLCGLFLGLAMLTRSVMALLPAAALFTHALVVKGRGLLRSPHAVFGAALAVGIPAIWYVSQYYLHGGVFVGKHVEFVAGKISSSPVTLRARFEGLTEYPALLSRSYWPWLPFLLVGLWKQTRRFFSGDSVAAFLVLFVLWIAAPLSLAQVRILRYLIPVIPVFSILAAFPLNEWLTPRRKPQVLLGVYCLVLAFLIVTTFFFPTALLRATDMKELAPVAEANTPAGERVILYTAGRPELNYQNQFLWYADRYSDLFTRLDYVRSRLESGENRVAIMDRPTFADFKAANTGLGLEVLGESERFVCFLAKRL